jgi:hypothetical protein
VVRKALADGTEINQQLVILAVAQSSVIATADSFKSATFDIITNHLDKSDAWWKFASADADLLGLLAKLNLKYDAVSNNLVVLIHA